jgi:hypothetical protein
MAAIGICIPDALHHPYPVPVFEISGILAIYI